MKKSYGLSVLLSASHRDIEQEIAAIDTFHRRRVDDRLGARLATEHLISLGHSTIGYLGVSDRSRSKRDRLEGYKMALAEAGLPQNPIKVSDFYLVRVIEES